MICYNLTIKVDPAIDEDWRHWLLEEHIPDVIATGMFDDYRFFRLLEQEDSDGITYVVQYFTSSLENYQRYINEFSPGLREKSFSKWGNRFVAFRTIMELVN